MNLKEKLEQLVELAGGTGWEYKEDQKTPWCAEVKVFGVTLRQGKIIGDFLIAGLPAPFKLGFTIVVRPDVVMIEGNHVLGDES